MDNLLTNPYKPLTNTFLDCRVTKMLNISKVTKFIEMLNLLSLYRGVQTDRSNPHHFWRWGKKNLYTILIK